MGRFARWRLVPVGAALVLALGFQWGCGSGAQGEEIGASDAGRVSENRNLMLASTTSTQDSGLFDVLLPAFEREHPEHRVKVLAVGTGEALEFGRQKDVDVLLVHAPEAESDFVEDGYGTERHMVMYNDFVLVGPAEDPARIRSLEAASEALAAIAGAEADFVSRGDDSGTHKKELSLWDAAGIEPSGAWYQEAGQGMGDVLRIASEKAAYTMVDRATHLNLRDMLDLEVLVESDPGLFNQYGVLPVVGAANSEGAQAFAEWVTSSAGQDVIADYGMEEFGQPLFTPNAGE